MCVRPLCDEARLRIAISRAIETTHRPQCRRHQLCTAVNSARCVDCLTQQLPVAVVGSPHRRFVLQFSRRPWSITVSPPRDVATLTNPNGLGPVPGVDVMAKRSQGWVKCEDRLPDCEDSSCSLPLVTTPRPRLQDSREPRRGRPESRVRSSGALGASMQREGAVPRTASFKIK
jgi:hypothetical protein